MITFKKPDVEQFFRTFAIQNFAVSPDETQLIFSTNLSGKYNLWAMDLPNQFPYPLTFIDQSNQELVYDKEGKFIIAGFDKDGDENTQLYALQTQGGELKPLRTLEGHRHMGPILSKDGKRLFYTSTKENPMYLNTYCYNLENGEESVINEGSESATYLMDVSPNEDSQIYWRHFANTNTRAYVLNNGTFIQLTPETDKQHTVTGVVFTSDTETYLLTNHEEDLTYLAKYDLTSGEFTKVLAFDKEDLNNVKFNKEQNKLYLTSSKGVVDFLYEYDLATGETNPIDTPTSVIEKLVVSKAGNLYILGRSATRPFNIYKRTSTTKAWQACTNYGVPGVAEEELVEPEVLTYPSFDGLEIEALFFKAKEEVSNGHVILWPHGGPQAAERKSFRALFQFLVNRGYSLFAPNFRGSSNYGLSFMKMVEGDWGYGPRLDNIEGLEYLIKNGYADREKILLMGGSFGGYMALLLHGRHAEYFKAVVDIFGPSDLFSFIDSVPEHWKPAMAQWVGDPVKDKEKLIEYSPITHLDGMIKPMLVIQGANDPRVVKAESDKIVQALQDKGINVEYLVLEDEGHGFSKKENEIKVNRTILEFFDRFI
ncbi:S9 family peptidase [Bacillus luteolus]|uniref:S9 family peptidase n=1 Tax=Litchfieldia luteola TaxID=682179 RepID=A0ABR9QJC2_9BACI|nr:S9 family peptidase [Cytobacillus luteolus]MBE4908600.1 S9 family peptidase [Cytobacillus luteolus]MBP1941455.1 dipeptidyl aminopeptidase/acylaminoacyl peptidase [Cytobacillus luteolus]